MFKRPDYSPMMYVIDQKVDGVPRNLIDRIDYRNSITWIGDLRVVSQCDSWNRNMISQVDRARSSVGWLNCRFSGGSRSRIALGLDLSIMGIISILRKAVSFALSFKVVDIRPSFPEIRKSICLATGHGQKDLKYWVPIASSKYFDLHIDGLRRVLKVRMQKFSSLSLVSLTCGCLSGNSHQVNGSVVELKFLSYHSCLMSSVAVGWGFGAISYKYNFAGSSPRPYRAFKGIEVYNPGSPAMLVGVGSYGDENLGMLDCTQNQNDDLWTGYI